MSSEQFFLINCGHSTWSVLAFVKSKCNERKIYIHTYIHNSPLQPFCQDSSLASHNTHVVCVNFIRGWCGLQINVYSECQIFEKLFMTILFILTDFFFCQKCDQLRGNRRRIFFFHTSFSCLTRALRLISHFTTTSEKSNERKNLPLNRKHENKTSFVFT